jgi:tetratricopeptide (TPR) repeat protein
VTSSQGTQSPTHIFISYRRDDSGGSAGRLQDALDQHFGIENVFRDVEAIKAGADFVSAIEDAIAKSAVLLAVIGRDWARIADSSGRRRLDDPKDLVRLEISNALQCGIDVLPVLVEGARMPAAEELPPSLVQLARHNAFEISDSRWDYDLERLVDRLEELTGMPRAGTGRPVRFTRSTWRQWFKGKLRPRPVMRMLAAAISMLGTVLGIYLGVRDVFERPAAPPPMTGGFNIAVAKFGSIDSKGNVVESQAGLDLAQSVFDHLRGELQSLDKGGFDLQVRGPGQIRTIKGETPEERAQAASLLSRKIRADVIVYGLLRSDGGGTGFVPEFFLNEHKLQKAEELGGQHALGTTIRIPAELDKNIVARKDLRDHLLGRTRALAEFVVGLSYYTLDRLTEASDHFANAQLAPGWDDHEGKEVLYLFLGNTAGKLNDLAKAEASYAKALNLEPEYARARLGASEVLYQTARGSCEAGSVDAAGMFQALESFRGAATALVQPPLADIGAKAAFGVGRVQECLSQALVADHWGDAEREFRRVIRDYGGKNERIRNLAAESHAHLGFIALPASDDADATARYRQALVEYEKAIQLSKRNDRRAFMHSMVGFIHTRLHDPKAAAAAYAEAIRLEPDPQRRTEYEARRQETARLS